MRLSRRPPLPLPPQDLQAPEFGQFDGPMLSKVLGERHQDLIRNLAELREELRQQSERQVIHLHEFREQRAIQASKFEDVIEVAKRSHPHLKHVATHLESVQEPLPKVAPIAPNAPRVPKTVNCDDIRAMHVVQGTRLACFSGSSQPSTGSQGASGTEPPTKSQKYLGVSTLAPAQEGMFKRIVCSHQFDITSGLLVILNAICMAAELEWFGRIAAAELGLAPAIGDRWPDDVFNFSEHFFCIAFTIEVICRILAFRMNFFKRRSNWLDSFVVTSALLENYFLAYVGMSMPDVTALRLLRLVKLTKAVRVVRMMRFFHPLRILVVSVAASVGSLWWSVVLLTICQFIASIGMTQFLHDFIVDPRQDQDLRLQVNQYFGSWSNSMLTMWQITLAPGAWVGIGRTLIFEVSYHYIWFFVAYVWVVTFAVIRVITAIFLQQTMRAVSKDDDIANHEQVVKQNRDMAMIRQIFEEKDRDGGGDLNRCEFASVFEDPRSKRWLNELGMEVSHVSSLFQLMDDGDGLITYDEFISGVLRLRGGARTVDLATLLLESKRIRSMLAQIDDHVCTLANGDEDAGNGGANQ